MVHGVAKQKRRIYKFWKEPAPQIVMEFSLRKTRKEDIGEKKDTYAQLGVREYFVFDPEAKLRAPLRAFRRHGTTFVKEMAVSNRILSEELGLELVVTENTLRLFNPNSNEFLRTLAEEAVRATEAEARVARLAAKLRELGIDPDHL